MEASIGDVRLDGIPLVVHPERITSKLFRQPAPRFLTDWFAVNGSSELIVHARADGQAEEQAEVFIERMSDSVRLMLPVLTVVPSPAGIAAERTHRYQWDVVSDPSERYRIVLSTAVPELQPIEDVEIEAPLITGQAKGGAANNVLDLSSMIRVDTSLTHRSLQISAIPNIAHDDITVLLVGNSTVYPVRYLDIVDVAGKLQRRIHLDGSAQIVQSARINIGDLSTGVYGIHAVGTSASVRFVKH
jgi:hypothetical protein